MMNSADPQNDQAIELVIPIARVIGAAMFVGGLAIALGIGNILSPEIGVLILVLGLIEFFVTPVVLRRAVDRKRNDFLAGKDSGNRNRQ